MAEGTQTRRMAPRWTPISALLRRELLERVRTGGHFAVRAIYVFVLFVIVLIAGADSLLSSGGAITRAPSTGRELFIVFSAVQYALVLLLIPLVGAGAIVEERKERSLGLLLLTELSWGQIAIGKVLARLGVVALIVLSSVPVLSLASILGGVEVSDIIRVFALTLSTATLFVGVTVMISAVAGSTLKAAVASYTFLIATLISLFGMIWLDPHQYMSWHPVVALTFTLAEPLQIGPTVWTCVAVNTSVGLAAVGATTILLRIGARRRRVATPAVGDVAVQPAKVWDNPIAWREWKGRGSFATWWPWAVSTALGLGLAVLMAATARESEMIAIALVGENVLLFALSMFALAIGSSAFAQEKREQTLDLLNLTFLTASQIIRGKMIGVLRLWLYGVIVSAPSWMIVAAVGEKGSIVALVAPQVGRLVVLLFFTAVSIFYSLVADSPMKAAFPAIGTFIYLSLGLVYWPLLMFINNHGDIGGLVMAIGYMPVWVPILVLVARVDGTRLLPALAMIGAWSAVVVGLGVAADSEWVLASLHPFALMTTTTLFVSGAETGRSLGLASGVGVVLLLSASGIFVWAAARLLEETRRIEASESESAWIAGVLAGILPGAGQLYLTRVGRGVVWIVIWLVAAAFFGLVALIAEEALLFIGILLVHAAAALDAGLLARRLRAARIDAVRQEANARAA